MSGLTFEGGKVSVFVGLGDARIIRSHVRSCPVCLMHDRPSCSEALTLIEGALSMAGLYDMTRMRKEKGR